MDYQGRSTIPAPRKSRPDATDPISRCGRGVVPLYFPGVFGPIGSAFSVSSGTDHELPIELSRTTAFPQRDRRGCFLRASPERTRNSRPSILRLSSTTLVRRKNETLDVLCHFACSSQLLLHNASDITSENGSRLLDEC